ncbi:hypothetical protein SEA_RASPUTIA_32 [Microbacterium phage Rasputia]|nr:hypothetical protein SEA_RASPUTIA_32 [Microbacterium phage Rasputia]
MTYRDGPCPENPPLHWNCDRCTPCNEGLHEACRGWVYWRCECYCQDLDEEDSEQGLDHDEG